MIMKDEKKVKTEKLTISFQGRDKCVNVGKDVVRLLGAPPFISLFLSEDGMGLAISASTERNPSSFAVPKDFLIGGDRSQMRIYSKQFVDGVLCSLGLNNNRTYRVKGTYLKEHNLVTFLFSDFQGLAKDMIIVV